VEGPVVLVDVSAAPIPPTNLPKSDLRVRLENFLCTIPAFELFLASYRVLHAITGFEVKQAMTAVSHGKTFNQLVPVLMNSAFEPPLRS
jgi:hypothetical protein